MSSTVYSLPDLPSPNYFPVDVLKWMKISLKRNANYTRVALKLMQICKFFEDVKYSMIVVNDVISGYDTWKYSTVMWEISDSNKRQIISTDPLNVLSSHPKNLWLNSNIWIKNCQLSDLLKRTVGCDIRKIDCIDQKMMFNEFKFLTSGRNVKELVFTNTTVCFEEDEAIVPLEMIFDRLPNVEKICIKNNVPNYHFDEEIFVFHKLKNVTLGEISGNFNIEEFCQFMLKHQNTVFHLVYDYRLHAENIKRIQFCIDEIFKGWQSAFNLPLIFFH